MTLSEVLFAVGGMVLGYVIAWLILRSNSAALQARLLLTQEDLKKAREEVARQAETNTALHGAIAGLEATIKHEQRASAEKLGLLNCATGNLREAFQALAADALNSNNRAFLELAQTRLEKFQSEAASDLKERQTAVETLIAPITESLRKVDNQIQQIEKTRNDAYVSLRTHLESLVTTQERLHTETGNLVKALRAPNVRGQWGEIQLKRVVEIAGMVPYCDFIAQETVKTSAGRFRPDLIVRLPGAKSVVVDAKTPLLAYLQAVESQTDEVRRQKLLEHAGHVRTHIDQLSSKAYWAQFESAPEFVVMFLPSETFFSAALEQDPALIEYGAGQRVIPASPTTLIALLKAVAYGWNQERLARNAQEISTLGKELHERLRQLAGYFQAIGKGLDRAVESYNKAVGSLEGRVLVSARKFAELGASAIEQIPELSPIETTARNLTLEFDEVHTNGVDSEAVPDVEPRQNATDAVLGASDM